MTKRTDNRRENLKRLRDEWLQANPEKRVKDFAAYAGFKSVSWLSQLTSDATGPNARTISEKTARDIEVALGLEEGSLDWVPEDQARTPPKPKAGAAATTPAPAESTLEVVRLMAKVCADSNINLPPLAFSEAVSLAVDSGNLTPEFLAKIAKLHAK